MNEKEQREKEKLELEIKLLKRPWYSKASYLRILIPFFLGIASLFLAFQTGYFNTKHERLKLDEDILALKEAKFELKRGEIQKDIDSLTTSMLQYKDSLVSVTDSLESLYKNIKRTELERAHSYFVKDLRSELQRRDAALALLRKTGNYPGLVYIQGLVRNKNTQEPIANAKVEIKDGLNKNIIINTKTGSNGMFKIGIDENIMSRIIYIVAAKNGFHSTVSRSLYLRGNSITDIVVKLI